MTALVVLAVVLVAALAVGALLRARSGTVRATESGPVVDETLRELLTEAGVNTAGPTVLHFSADWCGPCAAVRRVIHQVLGNLDRRLGPDAARPLEVEVDIDENPALAKELGVLSLPTTFIFDAALVQRHRISGVPSAADLEAALLPLCGPDNSISGKNG